jgi:hypothetical protein
MDAIHQTEVDGMTATWRLDRCTIAIVSVCGTTSATPQVVLAPGDRPDLAEARERWPQLARLWDAVRHEFWAELLSPQCHSHPSHGRRWT